MNKKFENLEITKPLPQFVIFKKSKLFNVLIASKDVEKRFENDYYQYHLIFLE